MKKASPIALLYNTYNSLFLYLPFQRIEERGTQLALFAQECKHGFDPSKRAGSADGTKGKKAAAAMAPKSPVEIIETYWADYLEKSTQQERINLLFYFIQYTERQVVLFDSLEDAQFEQTHDLTGAGTVANLLTRIDTPVLKAKLLEKLRNFSVRLVLTAHPTQFYPGKVLGIINDLGKATQSNDLPQVHLLLKQLGKTAFVNKDKPTPFDEATSLMWYLENVFYHTMPDIMLRLLRGLDIDVQTFENPRLLALGFWPGGDRDGNPSVTVDITLKVASHLRETLLRNYHRDVRQLRRRLTFRGTEELIIKVERTLNNTLYHPDSPETYTTCKSLLNDLQAARNILVLEHDSLFLEDLDRFILKVRIFGFYFASLDLRQESRKHTEVWNKIFAHWNEKFPWQNFGAENEDEDTQINRLLTTNVVLDEKDFTDPLVRETIGSFKAIKKIQAESGELGCHRYIISNCGSALSVAQVLALAKMTIGGSGKSSASPQAVSLDVIPLFETIDDLAAAGDVMRKLYTNEHYAKHLAQRGKKQTIMLGFSDGTKDGGYLRANWSIYKAKAELSRISREYGIAVVFFDGRGGPPGRGGGNNVSYYAAHGPEIANEEIQVTIQGQTVSSTYGTQPSAQFNIERLFTAGLSNHVFDKVAEVGISTTDAQLMEDLAEKAYACYLDLKNHPNFVPYLEKMTPLKWYGDTNIASRPTKRNSGDGLKFEELRAIPFVGAWAQMKQNVPGYYGFGGALAAFSQQGRREELRQLYQNSLFFRTLVENSMQSLSKSNFAVTHYIAKDPQFADFWKMLHDEYERTRALLLDVSGEPQLLSGNAVSRESIELREAIVLPLIAIQQYALQKLNEENISKEDAEIYRKLVLRAMFGIINAARNAA